MFYHQYFNSYSFSEMSDVCQILTRSSYSRLLLLIFIDNLQSKSGVIPGGIIYRWGESKMLNTKPSITYLFKLVVGGGHSFLRGPCGARDARD